MRILIGLHHVTLGGDTINAVELADRLNRLGHDASLFAFVQREDADSRPPLLAMAAERHVRVWTFPAPAGVRDRVRLVARLRRLAREQRIDVVHSFGHQDTYYAFLAMHGLAGVPLVINDYGMVLTPGLPRRVPLVVGTRQVQEEGRAKRPGPTAMVEPPVDLEANRPDPAVSTGFRERLGIVETDVMLVAVSRLSRTMKAEGLRGSIEAVRLLDDPLVRLVIVGEGEVRHELERRAADVNSQLGREAVVLAGPMVDPRPAYAAADVVVGMGHSGLRAMAFGKPLVMLGERGFALALTPATVGHLDHHGVYGVGDGGDVAPVLAEALRPLIHDPELRASRGELARLVVQRFGLDAAAEHLEDIYRSNQQRRAVLSWTADAVHVARTYLPAKVRRAAGVLARGERRRQVPEPGGTVIPIRPR